MYYLSYEFRDLHISFGGDFAQDKDQTVGNRRLTGDAAVRVFSHDSIQHRIGDLVADFVRVALGDRF